VAQTPKRRRTLLGGAMLAAGLCSGCSALYVDAEGRRHVIGFVALTLPPADAASAAADTLRMRTLGLALTSSPVGSSITLGYSDDTLTAIHRDVVVRIPAAPSP